MTKPKEQKVAEVVDALEGHHRKWLENFAENHDCSYTRVMNGARQWLETGDYVHIGVDIDYEASGGEFWVHYQAMVGVEVPEEKRGNFFNCAC